MHGNIDKLQQITQRRPHCVHEDGAEGTAACIQEPHNHTTYTGTSGYTPLHYAARAGQLDAARLLLASGTCDLVGHNQHTHAHHQEQTPMQ